MSIVANEIIPKCTTLVLLTAALKKGDDLRIWIGKLSSTFRANIPPPFRDLAVRKV